LFKLLLTKNFNEKKLQKKLLKKLAKKRPKNISKENNISHGPLLRLGQIRNKPPENPTPKG
jgi:hypothetical protein